jgi:PAS domain S-box-containing protein
MRLLRRAGDVVHVDESVSLVRGPDGKPLYFVSQIEDITQRWAALRVLAVTTSACRRCCHAVDLVEQ